MIHRRHARTLLAGLALGVLLVAAPAALAQGEQEGEPETQWMQYIEAMKQAEEKSTGVLMYFPADGQLVDLPVFRDRDLAALSHETPFIKFSYDPYQPLRQKYELTVHTTIVITDWFGNPMKKMALAPPIGKYEPKQLVEALRSVPAMVKALDEKLAKSLEKLPKLLKRKKYVDALKVIDKVLEYEGYPAADKAGEMQKQVYEAGEALVKEAVEYAKKSKKRALEKLEKLAKEFMDTPVEDVALDAIAEVEAME